MEIETDHTKCRWSKSGRRPNFIKVERKDKKMCAWTCSDQLANAGFKK